MFNLDTLDTLGALIEDLESDSFILCLLDEYSDCLFTYPSEVAAGAVSSVLDHLDGHVRALRSVFSDLSKGAPTEGEAIT